MLILQLMSEIYITNMCDRSVYFIFLQKYLYYADTDNHRFKQ